MSFSRTLTKRGPESPDSTDSLTLSWFDGAAWVVADTWYGAGATDPGFSLRYGTIDDPLIVVGGTETARAPDRYEARCRTHHRVAPPRHGMDAPSMDASTNGHEEFSLSELPAP